MTTNPISAGAGLVVPSGARTAVLRRWWRITTLLLAAGIFLQAVLAGAMLSGIEWAPRAHAMNATLLTGAALAVGVIAAFTLRRVPHGTRFALTLFGLGAVLLLQTALGKMAADGANLMWAHVPLGVALVAFAMQAVRRTATRGEA